MNKDSIRNQNIAHRKNADNNDILAPFNPTNAQAQHLALDLLSLQEDDVLFDLGCGDARILIAAVAQIPVSERTHNQSFINICERGGKCMT